MRKARGIVFSVGQRVRCINGSFSYNALDWAKRFPVTGATYTIRGIGPQPHYVDRSSDLAVWLEEIVNPSLTDGVEPSFSASRFRAEYEGVAKEISGNDALVKLRCWGDLAEFTPGSR